MDLRVETLFRSEPANERMDHTMTKPDTPFPRHWLYYIVLKYGVIVVAVLIALYIAYRVM